MRSQDIRAVSMALALWAVAAGCSARSGPAAEPAPEPETSTHESATTTTTAAADSTRRPFTEADVHFISGMIGHHSQALLMSGWAPPNAASQSVRTLAARIINAQKDEIAIMEQWLRDRGQPVPEVEPTGVKMAMHGGGHVMAMPGMLTADQLKQLEEAKGKEFDRLFLTFMIQHHRGGIAMVKELLASPGAAQDYTVFKLAADINVDQETEVARMQRMLLALITGGTLP